MARKPIPPPEEEILFADSRDKAYSMRLSRWLKAGQVRVLAPRIYTTALRDEPAVVVRRNLLRIAAWYYPEGVVGFRSAMEGFLVGGVLYLTHAAARSEPVELPGARIFAVPGPGPHAGDIPYGVGLYRASQARALLECLQTVRGNARGRERAWDDRQAETWLERDIARGGDAGFNLLREQARHLAPVLQMEPAMARLDRLAGLLLGTRTDSNLLTAQGLARRRGEPIDSERLDRFSRLVDEFSRTASPSLVPAQPLEHETAWRNQAFFEAYFSNYIEGTRFEVDDAARICFEGQPMVGRPQDSHDVIGTYDLALSRDWRDRRAENPAEYLELIRARHRLLLKFRPEYQPGRFKDAPNRAGASVFVLPELVAGTLKEGFLLGQRLDHPLARAAYQMALVSEVHPFADGNGRLARLCMNAELDHAGWQRIVVTTAHRYEYIQALKRFTADGGGETLWRVLFTLLQESAKPPFGDYQRCLEWYRARAAFLEPYDMPFASQARVADPAHAPWGSA